MRQSSFAYLSMKAVVSLFGVGFFRPASASWGSLVAGVGLFFFWPNASPLIKLALILIVFSIGSLFSQKIEKTEKLHDPHFIVIDEVVGMMIVTFFLSQVWQHWLLAFCLFRIFDIAKIWPSSVFDRRSGGLAIMMDDVVAGLMALLVLMGLLSL